MYRTSPAIDELEIDHVLRRKRNQNEAKACIPCRRRKVKCDKSHPCNTCRKRGHPLICAYAVGHQSSAPRQSPRGESPSTARHGATSADGPDLSLLNRGSPTVGEQPENPSTQSARRRLLSTSTVQEESTKDYVFSGDNSIASIVRSQAQQSNYALELDVGPVLGLQNTFSSYPFMDLKSAQNRWAVLLGILPQRNEVLKFFQVYKSSNYLFTPILVDIDQFELEMCSYLSAHAAGEFQGQNPISDRWVSGRSLGFISLLLAVLAAGAHFSDIENPERSSICQDLEQRSFQALRLANFLLRPSSDIIQTLLILGSTLQNNGQSDAAWAMLGTTVRLAQTLGFHTERSMSHLPERLKSRARKCWSNIVWQDALLSLCHDRPPVTSRYISTDLAGDSLSYTDITDFICRLSLKVMDTGEPEAQDISHSINALGSMDNAYRHAQPHLQARGNCKTFHQHLEHLALKMHISLCVSYICRPAIRGSNISIRASDHDLLRQRAKESLMQASKAFLDFQALSTVPLRSWPIIHTVLSSTLLLCIWEETRNDSECRDLQQRVTEVFAAAEPKTKDNTSSASASESWQWLSERHARALVTLRNAFYSENGREVSTDHDRVEPPRNSPNPQSRNALNPDDPNKAPPSGFYNQLRNTFDYGTLPNYGFATEGFDPIYTSSPISYLDSIMNVPLFDFSEDGEFLWPVNNL